MNPEKFTVPRGGEWSVPAPGWWIFHVNSGSGYNLSEGACDPMEPGVTCRISPLWTGTVRASQISPLEIRAVRIDWSYLSALITPLDERFFLRAQNAPEFSFHSYSPTHPLAKRAHQLFQSGGGDLTFRVEALSVFVETLGSGLSDPPIAQAEATVGAAERVKRIIAETPSADLINLKLEDLGRRANCTPRHLRRIFRELLGVSFREKQTQLRLDRAVQLLSRPDTKIVDVAFESGFSSVSFFNASFKRRFCVPPRQWREEVGAGSRRR